MRRKSGKRMPLGVDVASDCPHAGSMQRALMQFSTTRVLHARIKPQTIRGKELKSAYHAPPYKFPDPMRCTEPAAESPLQAHGRSVLPSEPGDPANRECLKRFCRFNNAPLSPQISQCLQTQDLELPIESPGWARGGSTGIGALYVDGSAAMGYGSGAGKSGR